MKVSIAGAAIAALPLITATPVASPPGKHHGYPHGPKPGHGYDPKTPYPGLDVLAKGAGLKYFGTAIDNVVLNNSAYVAIAHNRSEFGQATPANGQKWMYTEPERNVFNYTMANEIIVPSKKAGQMRRCHTFVWHNQLPEWLTGRNWTKPELTEVLKNHIKNEATYFKNDCYAWDVVNEAFEDNGTYRSDIWLDTIGPEYIEIAFKTAKKYVGKGTRLYYNDYNIERVNNKSLAVSAMVQDFKKRGVPIDGVGLQAHFTVGRSPSYNDTSAALALFEKDDVETALTELDVRIELPDSAEKQEAQAKVYSDSVQACVDSKDCVGVTVWDFWDPVSWVPSTFPGYGNACLFDDDLKRKPAYYAISDMLRAYA